MLALFCTSQFVSAQEIGLRLEALVGCNEAVHAVFALGKSSRVHADVSYGGHGVGIEALSDFIYKSVDGEALKWYFGIETSVLFSSPEPLISVSGEIGLESRLRKFPIVSGLNHRPTLWILGRTALYAGGSGLNARYVFFRKKDVQSIKKMSFSTFLKPIFI